jgi:hypothetical protein
MFGRRGGIVVIVIEREIKREEFIFGSNFFDFMKNAQLTVCSSPPINILFRQKLTVLSAQISQIRGLFRFVGNRLFPYLDARS